MFNNLSCSALILQFLACQLAWAPLRRLFVKISVSILLICRPYLSKCSPLTLKGLGGGGSIWPPCGFSENVSSKERVKPWFFVTFNIILKHIISEIFIEFGQVVQKIWRNSLTILAVLINFPRFFGFFDITLLQRNWRQLITDDVSIFYFQHTLNRLFHNCTKLYWH